MIGIFDSGIGGLSVLAAIARALPQADLVYLADTAHLPYGDKDDAFIRRRVLSEMTDYAAMNTVWDAWLSAGTVPAHACLEAVVIAAH